MTERRKQTEQIKKMREIVEDIVTHSELLEQAGIRTETQKLFAILDQMEIDNENKREGER